MRKNITLSFCILLFTVTTAKTQNNPTSAEKVKVFLDCTREWLCDFDYVKQEMKMVDLVRDRFLADVHVQVVTNFVSGGGEQNQVIFIGQKKFASRNDTLSYFNNPTMTDDEKRKQLVKYLEIGLFPFIPKLPWRIISALFTTPKKLKTMLQRPSRKRIPGISGN